MDFSCPSQKGFTCSGDFKAHHTQKCSRVEAEPSLLVACGLLAMSSDLVGPCAEAVRSERVSHLQNS